MELGQGKALYQGQCMFISILLIHPAEGTLFTIYHNILHCVQYICNFTSPNKLGHNTFNI
jgi:hypothetical protein